MNDNFKTLYLNIELVNLNISDSEVTPVNLDWPVVLKEFDIIIEVTGNLFLDVGSNISSRKQLLDLAQGFGIEIGPGLNPVIKPSKTTRVEYIESVPISNWGELYKTNIEKIKELEKSGISNLYQIGDASCVKDIYKDSSLDFIFSNHVFEHLVNPISILETWSRKLKKGGFVLGVIPDFRHCFDLRQYPSLKEEWLHEYNLGGYEIDDNKLLRWIDKTSPSSNFASLRERKYSVHVHFYSPENFLALANVAVEKKDYSAIHFLTNVNGKDFGFVLVK